MKLIMENWNRFLSETEGYEQKILDTIRQNPNDPDTMAQAVELAQTLGVDAKEIWAALIASGFMDKAIVNKTTGPDTFHMIFDAMPKPIDPWQSQWVYKILANAQPDIELLAKIKANTPKGKGYPMPIPAFIMKWEKKLQ